ncbi:pilus assembly protein TadG-related protein [Telluria mixta]|uniref:Pilus assembly protein TadG-related protein n=1 Tax=Telluria mixta TaxID=34071 RepID=A0ABT2BSC3_9BURK|nr:pilus assembly protein TadG-related protein [Telluria mixta]MCS0628017.1 pilus assembly protein TadG-related protein [Telluria mixta]WEM93866.1 pilus assembly protein TadG-related protein [Telluria mixta]
MSRERGGVIVAFALLLMLLMGFMGLALDFGHLYIIRTELQTAMDACALAGAQELNGQPDALTRATNAGIAAGNANRVDMQLASWNGKGGVTAADIAFRDKDHVATTSSAAARYVRCTHTQPATQTSLLLMFGQATGTTAYAGTMDVGAAAEATTTPAQSTCPVPLAIRPKAGGAAPDYGFAKGDWVTLLSKTGATNGQIGWANLDGSNSASETNAELAGHCGTRVGDTLGTPGVQQSIADIWNTRFGIYKNGDGPSANPPDFTGRVYTGTSWSPGRAAYSDFVAKRQSFAPCAASVSDCEKNNDIKLNAQSLASSGAGGDMQRYGTNRRLVAVPVVQGGKVADFVCMLILQPLSTPMVDVQLEYLGNASSADSPCTGSGLPGGAAGPLVPVLVR